MDTKVFNVKDKSAASFFDQHSVISKDEKRDVYDQSPYYFMKDELYLNKSSGIQEGQHVVFELKDFAAKSKKKLINKYTYLAGQYDDVGIRLELVDFSITLVDTKSDND